MQGKKSKEFITHIRVIYGDTDKMGVVYNAKYLEYFERGRNELLRDAGYPYKRLEENNIYLPVREAKLVYKKPAHYDDLLEIKSYVSQAEHERSSLRMNCSIYRDKELLVEGHTLHIVVNEVYKPVKPNAFMQEILQTLFK